MNSLPCPGGEAAHQFDGDDDHLNPEEIHAVLLLLLLLSH
jgi:hypothetical protein